ncbi:MAG: competence/damage-inducible protein A [Bacteroidia bacterium]|nr:competence/damage-inducible protein A [Bacteroidia bacterium]MCF8425250.1 competence/damage-inducible protein A [Bacteroidia bacterium]MCF8447384.1 competence/damage-inducible protein A [Bacteroidia bacterium]
MKAEIITIGDELLLGQVIDTNSSWLGQTLNKMGINVHHKSAISDNKNAILQALSEGENRSDVIIITGGLGPTKDDITKATLCEYFDTELILNERVLAFVQSIFEKRNLPMLDSNNMQAMLPKNCGVLWNKNGTAPGMWFYENKTVFISMPGVPFEMKTIFEEEAIPKLKSLFSFPSILHRTLQTCSIGESFLAKKIESIEDALPSYIKLAYLPNIGSVRLRFSAYGENLEALEKELNPIIEAVYESIGEYIYGEGDESLTEVLGVLLKEKNATVSTAESCTGGFLAHQLTSVSGSSAYYMGSIISYDNRIKQEQLNIPKELLETFGAVSEECVTLMAQQIKDKFKTTYGIATSGIAGPTGGSDLKPVGTVWIALATPTHTFAKVFNMGDNRERTILRTSLMAMDLLRKELLQN